MKKITALLLCLPLVFCAVAQNSAPYTLKLPKDVLPAKTAAKVSLPTPTFKKATTRIDIHLLGRDSLVAAVKNASLSAFNPFLLENVPTAATMVSAGNFTVQFDQYATACIILDVAHVRINLMADPGEHAEVFIDLDAFAKLRERSYTGPFYGFRGKYAQLNEQLVNVERKLFALAKDAMPQVNLSGMTPQQYLETTVQRHRDLNKTIDTMKETDAVKQLLRLHLDCMTVRNIYNRRMLFDNTFLRGSEENKDYTSPVLSQDELVAMGRLINLNDPKLIYDMDYLIITTNIVDSAPTLQVLNQITGSTSGLMQDAWKNMPAIKKIAGLEALTPEEDSLLRSMPLRAQAYDQKTAQLRKEVAAALQSTANEFEVKQVPDVANEKILNSIAALHPGKIVMFDFWATWCGPCRIAIDTIKEIKPDLKKQDVVIIYMASSNSPKTGWSQMAGEIGGIHYYLTSEQWKAVMAQYEFRNIPTYIVFDKQGRKVFQTVGYPGNEEIKAELSKYR